MISKIIYAISKIIKAVTWDSQAAIEISWALSSSYERGWKYNIIIIIIFKNNISKNVWHFYLNGALLMTN